MTMHDKALVDHVLPVLRSGNILQARGIAAFDESIGRFGRDLSPTELEEVEREAGALLRQLDYMSG
jgi:hypothetical protein